MDASMMAYVTCASLILASAADAGAIARPRARESASAHLQHNVMIFPSGFE
jgi:hypothetical protein